MRALAVVGIVGILTGCLATSEFLTGPPGDTLASHTACALVYPDGTPWPCSDAAEPLEASREPPAGWVCVDANMEGSGFGTYLSIWRARRGEEWGLLVDAGIGDSPLVYGRVHLADQTYRWEGPTLSFLRLPGTAPERGSVQVLVSAFQVRNATPAALADAEARILWSDHNDATEWYRNLTHWSVHEFVSEGDRWWFEGGGIYTSGPVYVDNWFPEKGEDWSYEYRAPMLVSGFDFTTRDRPLDVRGTLGGCA